MEPTELKNPRLSVRVRRAFFFAFFLFMALYRALYVFGIYGATCPSDWLTITGPCQWSTVPFEIMLWGALLILFLLELTWSRDWAKFGATCKRFWPVWGFILLAGVSAFWSVQWQITLYKTGVLLLTTLVAVYFGESETFSGMLRFLTWFMGGAVLLSYAFVLFLPQISIMHDPFYHGAWNGIFWHRNYLGCFAALAAGLALLHLLQWRSLLRWQRLLTILLLVSSVLLVVKSKSATGLITLLALIAACVLLALWLKWGHHLRRRDYAWILGVLGLVAVLILVNLNFLFGLLGRNTSLTGRVPMWSYVYHNLFAQRPLLGYGYQAIWALDGIRSGLGEAVKWDAAVVIGDNGAVDMALHLGIVGLVYLFILFIEAVFRSFRCLREQHQADSFLPLLLLLFTLVGNIALSLFLQSETFVWALLVASQVPLLAHVRLRVRLWN